MKFKWYHKLLATICPFYGIYKAIEYLQELDEVIKRMKNFERRYKDQVKNIEFDWDDIK